MDLPPQFPEFDPQLTPIGYVLACELHGDGTADAIVEARSADGEDIDLFGWEYDTAA